ncbi:hypothetical protein WISP_118950 [Willisornis vidua]|uniref:Uncharacterized protein n=1 Tax=Willisornis vidua TaxID=1566151 RepID=A0ABQ9CXP7_9PASS|nr:hypothetical protein WISP_118950 [Willisornis vidua]
MAIDKLMKCVLDNVKGEVRKEQNIYRKINMTELIIAMKNINRVTINLKPTTEGQDYFCKVDSFNQPNERMRLNFISVSEFCFEVMPKGHTLLPLLISYEIYVISPNLNLAKNVQIYLNGSSSDPLFLRPKETTKKCRKTDCCRGANIYEHKKVSIPQKQFENEKLVYKGTPTTSSKRVITETYEMTSSEAILRVVREVVDTPPLEVFKTSSEQSHLVDGVPAMAEGLESDEL